MQVLSSVCVVVRLTADSSSKYSLLAPLHTLSACGRHCTSCLSSHSYMQDSPEFMSGKQVLRSASEHVMRRAALCSLSSTPDTR